MLRYLDETWIIPTYCLSDVKHKKLETTLMFGVIETKQSVDYWIVHLSMGCFGNTRILLKSPFSLGNLELWFQVSLIFQMNLRKFANGWAHLRSPVTAHLFWDMLFSSANANLTSSWVYFFLSLSLNHSQTHTHTHGSHHTQFLPTPYLGQAAIIS